jgi:ParB family chromosome partitioning protein
MERLDTRVKVDVGAARGKVVIEFASLEDLQRIVELIDPNSGS